MGIEARALTRPLRAAAAAVVLTAVTGCVSATTQHQAPVQNHIGYAHSPAFSDDDFHYRDANTTVRAGLKGIVQRYINAVDVDQVALDGMRGLATIDPQLNIESANGMVQVFLGEDPIAEFARPVVNSAGNWAAVTTNVVHAGREHSADLQDADNERVYEAIFDGMLAGLDIYSRYAGAEQARANRARRDGFGGIGIRFTKAENGILLTHVQEDGPAHAVGLKPGDVMLKINGEKISDLSLRRVAHHLRGPVGSPLTLTVARLDSDINNPERHISFSLSRAHIVPDTVRASVENDTLHLRVSSFNKKTTTALHDLLREHDTAFKSGRLKGVVMDLRGNPGGLLSQSVSVADLFLDRGRIIATRGRHPDSFHDYRAGGDDLLNGKPLVILVDGDSASAAEIVASALQDLGRAVVVGSSSYGKGTVQTVLRLPNDGEMTLTWSRLVSPSGYALHGLGVMPAVCATNTPLDSAAPLPDTILTAEHIDGQREPMTAWRNAGLLFDGRRSTLRESCPARSFKPGENGDILMAVAVRVIHDPALYRRAILLSEPISTASRH